MGYTKVIRLLEPVRKREPHGTKCSLLPPPTLFSTLEILGQLGLKTAQGDAPHFSLFITRLRHTIQIVST